MNKQSQWLFEAPFLPSVTQYNSPYTTSEYFDNPELADGCRNQTSDCPPSRMPTETVSGYITHDTKVPAGERRKIQAIASNIVRSVKLGAPSIQVCIVGHADQDSRGEEFERKISRQRAEEVMGEMRSAIRDPLILSKVSWKLVCAGKDNPIVQFNKPLAQRLRNRRVEIFIATSSPPPPTPPEYSCGSLLLWINAFIPRDIPSYTFTIPSGLHAGKTAIPCPLAATPVNPSCPSRAYLTDQRFFDPRPTVSVRMRSIAEIELVSRRLLRANHETSGTTEIDKGIGPIKGTGAVTCFKLADMSRCKFDNFSSRLLPSGTILINLSVKAAASDPCVNLGADIDYEGNIEILFLPSSGTVEVGFNGQVDSFPAFEMYASLNGITKTLFKLSPPPGNTVMNLLGGASTPVAGKAVFSCTLISKGAFAKSTRTLKRRPFARVR